MWWEVIKRLLKKIPWQIWVCAGVLVAGYSWGEFRYHEGKQEVQTAWDDAVRQAKQTTKNLSHDQKEITKGVTTVYVDRVKVIHEKADTIIKYIPKYIPDGSCMLPGGFRLLHDAAATNTIPEAPGGVDDIPVSAQEATATVTENYATCQVIRSNLISLQTWVSQQYNLYLEQCKQRGVDCSTSN